MIYIAHLGAVLKEPLALHDLGDARAPLWVGDQHAPEQAPGLGGDAPRGVVRRARRAAVRVQIGQRTGQHVVQQHTARPHICCAAVEWQGAVGLCTELQRWCQCDMYWQIGELCSESTLCHLAPRHCMSP